VFDGRFSVAQGVVSPNFDGYRPNICKYCKLDVTAAKDLLAQAGGWKGGKLVLWANAGAGHDAWLKAVGDQLNTNLGIEYELRVNLEFPAYLDTAAKKGFSGPFRLGWGPDYPVIETYLAPLYGTGGSSNNGFYTNPTFDGLITQGDGAATLADGIKFYQQAEDIVVEDLPVLPMWFGKVTAVYNESVSTFVYNAISGVSYGEITVKQA
jgi:ABC-type transport system substrate-binding protein